MNKKMFDIRLYLESLRELKVLGIVALIIYLAEAILLPINCAYTSMSFYSLIELHPIVVTTYTVVIPIFTLYLFSFLNKRNSSDFFHSIPHTRTCVTLSFFAGIMSWVFIIMSVSTAVIILLSNIIMDEADYSKMVFFKDFIGLFIASFAVCAAICLAQSITGTTLSTIIVTGIILFVPDIFILAYIEFLSDRVYRIIPSGMSISPLIGKYNAVTAFFTSDSFEDSFSDYRYFIYTFIMGLIYLIIAVVLLNKRKSEAAGNSAPNKILQDTYRIIFTLTACLIPISAIFDYGNDELELIITCYVAILIMYFVYEIITTKTVRNLLRTIPGVFIVAILNIVIIISINTIGDSILSTPKNVSEIDYIKFDSNYEYNTYSYNYDVNKIDGPISCYANYILNNIVIDNEDSIKEIYNTLQKEINYRGKDIYDYDIYCVNNSFNFTIVDKKGNSYIRRIQMDENSLVRVLENNSDSSVMDNYLKTLPSDAMFINTNQSNSEYKLNSEQMNKVYTAFIKDYENLSDKRKLTYILDRVDSAITETDNVFSMIAYTKINGTNYILGIPVSPSYPNTYKEFIKCCIENNPDNYKVSLNNPDSYTDSGFVSQIYYNNFYQALFLYNEQNLGLGTSDNYDELKACLKTLSENVIDNTKVLDELKDGARLPFIQIDRSNDANIYTPTYEMYFFYDNEAVTDAMYRLSELNNSL